MSSHPKIAVLGAGPAGLTLATILQKHNIPATIFEVDASPYARSQGGTLDLHPDGGQLALREAGLWEQFVKYARPEGDVLKVVKNNGEVLWDGNGSDARLVTEEEKFDHRPEINRDKLKEVLLAGVKPNNVKWGMKLEKVIESESEGTWDLHFADESVEKGFDVVVGADGAWSKVRDVLSDVKPHYSGISVIELWALNVESNNPWMSQYVGAGSLFSFGEGRTIQIQRLGDGTIRTYACLRKPESFLRDCGIDWTNPGKARKELVESYFGDCGEELKALILESGDNLIPRALYMLPVGFRWKRRKGVTLVGDAAHLMTPFAGVGVNAAMSDSLELGRALVGFVEAGDKSLEMVIGEYEKALFPRGEKFAQRTMRGLNGHFRGTGCEELVKRLKGVAE